MPYIKKLVMKGFKSFAFETEIPFQNSMNVVVGPNGSGKSNIADAICFVLGRLSIKSIRAAKSANLIFSGTKTHKPAPLASVKLVFDNSDKGFFLDKKEIEIERIVKRSGQSVYKINQETKTRQEVLELLAQAGIDPHGFNIVLQGTITDMIKANSEERRKIIEQVAGISVYEVRKEKSLHELEKTDAKLKEISAVLRERTAYLRNLEQERQQALKFKQLEKLVQRCKASIIHKKIYEKKKETEKIKLSLDKLENQKQKARKELNLVQDNITSLEQQIEDINKKIQTSTGIVQEKLYAQLTELRETLAGLDVHKQNSERKLEDTLSRRERAEKDVKEFQFQIQELRKKSPLQAKKQSQLEQKKKDFEELESQRKKFYTIKAKLEAIKQRVDDKKYQLQKNNNETQFILKQINELESTLKFNSEEKARDRLDELRKELANTSSKLEQAEKDKLILEKQLSISQAELDNLDKIKKQVSKLDTCPLCKSKITEEHLKHVYQDCDEKIQYNQDLLIKTRNNLENINKEIISLKSAQENLRKEISTLGIQIIKLENLTQQTLVIKRLENEKKELQETLQTLEQDKKTHEALQLKFRDVEGKYEQTLLEIEEISARTEENIDLELELKERDLERTKLIIKQSHRDQEELEQELGELEKEIDEKSSSLQDLEQQEKTLQAKYKKLFEEREKLQENIHVYNKESLEKQNQLNLSENESNNLKVEKAKLDAELENLNIDFETYKSAEIIQASFEILQDKLAKTEQTLALIGSVNLRALEVYDEIKKEYDEVANKASGLEKEKLEILKIIEEIDKKKRKTFIRTLKAINELFSRNFAQLSTKGQVFLNIETPKPKEPGEQENKEDVFAGGLGITVKVGQGKYFDVTSLSGGEQTLVSLSLLFAIQEYKPYSFYIFDEVDAALDKRNSERLAVLIKKYMKTGQYIIVTHNDAIITESSLLYGVSMQDGLSKILSLEV